MSYITSSAKVPKKPCFCQPLHYDCDPASCSEALSGAWQSDTLRSSWDQVVDSANAECTSCQILRQGVELFEDWIGKADRELLKEVHVKVKKNPLTYGVEVTLLSPLWKSDLIFDILQLSPSGCNAFPTRKIKCLATGLSSSFKQCREWVRNCRQTHKACQDEDTLLPRRVIDIGHVEGDKFAPRLYETNNEIGEYSALSHCWGPTGTSTLTTTIETLKIGYQLELRYIWIDSLCIIQNDTLDWEIESKQMGSIYGHSRVTIAALKSEDGSGGCFDSIDKVYPHPAGNTFMASRRQPDHSMWGHYQAVNTRLPLFSRAWTLQEELLAPRVLYFGPEELVFQCRSAQACHCGKCPYEWDTAKQMYESAFLKSSSLEEARNSWASIVQQYSSRSLTKETDRFPAISGLAKTFEGRGLGKYIAGLWTHDLPIWLTWRRQYHGSRGAAGANSLYVAPSWSWASMAAGTQVYFNWDALKGYKPSDSNVHLLEAVCDPVGVDHTGALRSGYLHVRGRVILADLLPAKRSHVLGEYRLQNGPWETEVILDVVPESDQDLYRKKVYCLLFCSLVIPNELQFILILRAGERPGEYRRCGIGIIEKGVKLTEDFEQSTKLRAGSGLRYNVRKCNAFEAWFKDKEEEDIILL